MSEAQTPSPSPKGGKGVQRRSQRCSATTKAGNPCKNPVVLETGTCIAHAPREVVESRGFGGPQPGAGRPRTPKVVEVIRERLEAQAEEYLKPVEDALKATRGVVVGDGAHARIEYVEDHATRLKAFRELMDRGFGKPTQYVDVTSREEESEIDREIRALLDQMDRLPSPEPSANGNGNGRH